MCKRALTKAGDLIRRLMPLAAEAFEGVQVFSSKIERMHLARPAALLAPKVEALSKGPGQQSHIIESTNLRLVVFSPSIQWCATSVPAKADPTPLPGHEPVPRYKPFQQSYHLNRGSKAHG